ISAALAPYPVDKCRIEDLATNNIFCLAEPSGIGAPYFRHDFGIYYSQSVEHLTNKQIAALLLEAIIFRVAQILEEFHDALPITHVYLSGGLSAIPCLQQGIAQCVPYEISRLQQKESSLLGAAMLAAGLRVTHQREESKIAMTSQHIALYEKYQLWKRWLDTLLNG
ncbi:MAG: carbohydrate kinase, partial [Nitrosomonas sp.]|nr:carbohydrate kinase [Nitrosomonas sp.]